MKLLKITAISAALLILLPSCAAERETDIPLEEAVEVKYDTADVVRKDLASRNQYEAYVRATVEVVGYEEKSGILEQFYVQVGDIVKKGEPVARLDVSSLESQIASMQDNLEYKRKKLAFDLQQKQYDIELAEIDLEALEASGADESKIEIAKLAVEKLKAEKQYIKDTGELEIRYAEESLAELENEMEGAVALAPCDGEVVALAQLKPGDRVPAYTQIAHIADNSRLYVQYDGTISMSTTIRSSALIRGKEFELALMEYDENEYLTMVLAGKKPPTRFSFADAPEGVKAGDFAALLITTKEVKDVLVVPINALYYSGGIYYVYRMVDGEKIYTEVTCGMRTESYAEIISGLEEGDEVFVKQ